MNWGVCKSVMIVSLVLWLSATRAANGVSVAGGLPAEIARAQAAEAALENASADLGARVATLETGIGGYEIVFHEEIQQQGGTVDATCPPGKKILGGGGASDSPFFTLFASRPAGDDSWHVALDGPFNTPHAARAWAICAPAP